MTRTSGRARAVAALCGVTDEGSIFLLRVVLLHLGQGAYQGRVRPLPEADRLVEPPGPMIRRRHFEEDCDRVERPRLGEERKEPPANSPPPRPGRHEELVDEEDRAAVLVTPVRDEDRVA